MFLMNLERKRLHEENKEYLKDAERKIYDKVYEKAYKDARRDFKRKKKK